MNAKPVIDESVNNSEYENNIKNKHKQTFEIKKCHGINVMYTNADVLHNKMDEIEYLASAENLDIIAITETLLKNMPKDARPEDFLFSLKGYTTLYNYNGRGLCLFVKKSIDFNQINKYEDSFKTSIFINIKNPKYNLMFGVLYRSPNTSYEDSLILTNMIDSIAKENMSVNNTILLLGDFNFPGIDWELETTKHTSELNIENKFLSCIKDNFLFQMVSQATHNRGDQTPTLIDLVITNDPELLSDLSYNAPVGKSHHSCISFKVYVDLVNTPHINNSIPIAKYDYEKGDYEGMRKEVKDINWKNLFDESKDVNEWNKNLEKVITDVRDKYVPRVHIGKCKGKKVKSFPVDNTVLDKLHNKRKAFKYYKKYPTTNNRDNYHFHRNVCNSAIRVAKLNKEINIAKRVKDNPKSFFNYFNAQIKPKEGISNLKKEDGTFTENDQDKAEVLNTFFSSVFVEEGDDPIPELKVNYKTILDDISINEENMLQVLKNLKISKSPGPDGIHPRILRELCHELAHPLLSLFNKTVQDGELPSSWKEAEVKPIFKKGSKEDPGNYRPVSLTSIICKIFENFVRDALYTHLITNSLLSKEQYGFCKKRSCVSQLIVTLNEWFTYLDNKVPIDAAYLDFRKAFDSVPHQRLIYKLKCYGIRGKVLEWITSFLSNRSQYVNVNNNFSDKTPVTSGVPQGSVLGPCLFIYYINDLPELIKCLIKIFADDTKAYQAIKSLSDNELLQWSINKLVEWTDKWLLKFNSNKCKILHLGKNNPKHKYYIKQGDIKTELSETTCEKDLGVYIDPNLSFDHHISQTIKKARKIAGMIIRTIRNRFPIIMVTLFKSLVRPILEYANAVWCPYKKKHIYELERVQRNFTKRIKGLKHMTYNQRLAKLNLPSLEFRRLRGDYIEVYKILHNIYDPLTTDTLLTIDSNNITRTNTLKLKKNRVNYLPYQKFFTNRVITNWNRLSRDIVRAESLNSFKNKLDNKFRDLKFQTNINQN